MQQSWWLWIVQTALMKNSRRNEQHSSQLLHWLSDIWSHSLLEVGCSNELLGSSSSSSQKIQLFFLLPSFMESYCVPSTAYVLGHAQHFFAQGQIEGVKGLDVLVTLQNRKKRWRCNSFYFFSLSMLTLSAISPNQWAKSQLLYNPCSCSRKISSFPCSVI